MSESTQLQPLQPHQLCGIAPQAPSKQPSCAVADQRIDVGTLLAVSKSEKPSPKSSNSTSSCTDNQPPPVRPAFMSSACSTDSPPASTARSQPIGGVTLTQLVDNSRPYPLTRRAFHQYLKTQFCDENLDFLVEAKAWRLKCAALLSKSSNSGGSQSSAKRPPTLLSSPSVPEVNSSAFLSPQRISTMTSISPKRTTLDSTVVVPIGSTDEPSELRPATPAQQPLPPHTPKKTNRFFNYGRSSKESQRDDEITSQLLEEAKVLVLKYLVMGSERELNVSFELRKKATELFPAACLKQSLMLTRTNSLLTSSTPGVIRSTTTTLTVTEGASGSEDTAARSSTQHHLQQQIINGSKPPPLTAVAAVLDLCEHEIIRLLQQGLYVEKFFATLLINMTPQDIRLRYGAGSLLLLLGLAMYLLILLLAPGAPRFLLCVTLIPNMMGMCNLTAGITGMCPFFALKPIVCCPTIVCQNIQDAEVRVRVEARAWRVLLSGIALSVIHTAIYVLVPP